MKVMGLDLSLNGTGIVITNDEGTVVHSETLLLNKNKMTPAIFGMKRICYIYNKIFSLIDQHSPDAVVIEGYSFGSMGQAVVNLGEIGGVIRHELFRRNIQYFEVPPKTLKKFITKNGNAKKEEMEKVVATEFGVTFPTSDETDAFCLCVYFLRELKNSDFVPVNLSAGRVGEHPLRHLKERS